MAEPRGQGTPPAGPLYKFTEKRWADAIMATGQVRVGTLKDFRNEERFGPELGDAGEGKLVYEETVTGTKTIGDLSWLGQHHIKGPPGQKITFEGAIFRNNVEAEDCFIYCVSTSSDQRTGGRLEYDACVKIVDPLGFFRAIGAALSTVATWEGMLIGPVKYLERLLGPDQQRPAALVKPPRFAHQCEVRGIYLTASPNGIKPVTLPRTEVAQFCVRVY